VVCLLLPSIQRNCTGAQRRSAPERGSGAALSRLREVPMYSILYIIGAIVVIVVVLKVLGLF
jgi:hypothetical protein